MVERSHILDYNMIIAMNKITTQDLKAIGDVLHPGLLGQRAILTEGQIQGMESAVCTAEWVRRERPGDRKPEDLNSLGHA